MGNNIFIGCVLQYIAIVYSIVYRLRYVCVYWENIRHGQYYWLQQYIVSHLALLSGGAAPVLHA
jgi:hypothetical protein